VVVIKYSLLNPTWRKPEVEVVQNRQFIPTYKFGGSIHISEMAEAKAVKFCMQVGYINSYEEN